MTAAAAPQTRRGVGVSPGGAYGPVVQVGPALSPPPDEPAPGDPDAALAEVRAALESVAASFEERARHVDHTAGQVLEATAAMARDPGLLRAAGRQLLAGRGPCTAVATAVEEYCAGFEAAGGPVADRVSDLRDIGSRAVAALLGVAAPGVPHLRAPGVLVAHDLAPADAATLDPTLVLGIVTEAGGPTGHTAILAAQLGIPAVVQVPGATGIPPGTPVSLDGDSGEVTVAPDPALLRSQQARRARRTEAPAAVSGPGATRDGFPVALLANISGVRDAEAAAALDLEGVGLFRTEVLYLSAEHAPSVEEQAEVYKRVFRPFGTRRVVVRTLDAGADKPLAFADPGPEANPALGMRGLRLSAQRPELLDTQLSALAAAAFRSDADVWVMAPMVATAQEAAWFARRAHDVGLRRAGVMVEVPAAALRARHLLAEVEFASIGTNDLAQYTMAADRGRGELADLLDPWQPAVLDLVAAACDGAQRTGRPVGACGESAGAPLMALVLAGLGASSLSMAPGRVPLVRLALSLHTLAECREMADAAREARSAGDALDAVRSRARTELTDLL